MTRAETVAPVGRMLLAALALIVAAQATPPTLRIVDPPTHEYVAHGVVPVPAGVDVSTLAVPEASSEQLRVFGRSAVWQLVDVAARVPAGTRTLTLKPGAVDARVPRIPVMRAYARRPPVRLVIEGHGDAREVVDLGQGVLISRGPCRWTAVGTARTASFGTVRWFSSASDIDQRVWLTLRWSNAVDAQGRARSEFLFRSARLEPIGAGVRWSNAIPDPAMGDGYLVKPADHVFRQRSVRDFRVVLHTGEGAEPSDGWGCADWSAGGFLPAGWKVPKDIGDARAAVDQRWTFERDAMAANRPTGGTTDPTSGPVSFLWPHAGVWYGGMTGGIDVWPCDGAQTASTAKREGLKTHQVLFERYLCRQLLIWEPDGTPVVPERHFVNGSAQWDTFDFQFLRDSGGAAGETRDAPWEFDHAPRPTGPRGYDPSQVAPIDWQHAVRAGKDALALVWLDADQAAIEYVTCMAEHARMTFWPGPGRVRLAPPVTAGRGWSVGRADAWSLHFIAAAAMFGRAGMRQHAQVYVDGCKRATMPSGLFAELRDGKVVTDPPLSGLYLAQRGNELAYWSGALRELEALGLDVSSLIANAARGTRDLAWAPGTGGCWDRHVLGPLAPGAALYRTRAEVPPSAQTFPDPYYSGFIVGAFGLEEQYREWLAGGSLAGRVEFHDAPIELWLPALSRWGGQ